MAFCQLHWSSEILRRQTTTWMLLPDKCDGPFPVFYCLHGLTDDHTTWIRKTSIERYVAEIPLAVVFPDGGRSFYADHENGPRWSAHIAEELPAMIEKQFQARTDRAGRCIGGLSMGGYGAMRLALEFPDRYISANSHSGALNGPSTARGVISIEEVRLVVGEKFEGSQHDLSVLLASAKSSGALPKLRIDCGTEDHLLEDSRWFHRLLNDSGVEHEYAEFPGRHAWEYWDQHVQEAIAFHVNAMGLG